MGWASERKAIHSRFALSWTTTPIQWDDNPMEDTHDPYVAVFIINGSREQLTLGASPTIQSVSAIIIQVFTPADGGSHLPKTYADQIAAIFDRAQFFTDDGDLISCLTASAEYVGKESEWLQHNVTIPYTREEN